MQAFWSYKVLRFKDTENGPAAKKTKLEVKEEESKDKEASDEG